MTPRANVLVAYALLNHPLRSTVQDHLYSFGRFSEHRVFYVNLAVRDLPRRLRDMSFDLVIFHTSLLATRWTPWLWRKATARALALPRREEVRVAMPQDEFLRPQLVSDFAREAGVDRLFSVAPESEWDKLYPGLEGMPKHRVLTGYLDDETVARAEALAAPLDARPATIGYRGWRGSPWLGRQATLKVSVAERVAAAARARGIAVDVSTRQEDTFFGDDWFRFLGRCAWQVGVEGGASILDRDGSLMERSEVFLADHPDASFDEVEAACFPGRDGELALFALSPRHLEACATRTAQLLVQGSYSGVLRPGEHYLELAADLSNLDSVLDAVERDDRRAELVANAHRDVVASGRYTYRAFVKEVERVALPEIAAHDAERDDRIARITRRLDELSWRDVALRVHALDLGSRLVGPTARRVRYARRRRRATR